MKLGRSKASRFKASGILFILSGATWLLAAALGHRLALAWVGVAFFGIGGWYLSIAKKAATS